MGKFYRWLSFLKRGHSAWFAFILSFMNFVVLQYKLMIESVPFLLSFFPSLIIFTVTFAIIYIPLATLIGRIDYKKGLFPVESSVAVRATPFYQDLAEALSLICDDKPEEAKLVLKKWKKSES